MSRISSYSSNTQLVNRLLKTQARMLDLQAQVNSQKKSQIYSGIARDSQRLINIENSSLRLKSYISNNDQQQTRLSIAATAVEGMRDTISRFQDDLRAYSLGQPLNAENIANIQDSAFRSLRDMEDLLNTEVDGRYIFAGSRSTTQPVDLGVNSVASFQSTYDGALVKVPTTRDAHMETFSVTSDKNNINNLYVDNSNFLQFSRDGGGDTSTTGSSTIRATSSIFSNLSAGSTITIDDTTNNNGTYTVESVSSDGQTVTVSTKMLTDETLPTALTTETPAGAVSFLIEGDTGGSPSVTAVAGDVTFNAANGTITDAGGTGLFSGLAAGDFFTVSGSGSNNATYKVASIDATNSIITIDENPTKITLPDASVIASSATGNLSFSRSGDTITATTGGAFSSVTAGQVITVAGTDENNGTYTVESVSSDGKTITIASSKLTDEGLTSGNTFFDQFTNTDIEFVASSKTIEVRRDGTATAVPNIFEGLSVGDQFTVTNSTSNNATFTIASISSDGSSVTVEETVTDETDTDGANFAGSGNSFAYISGTQLAFTDASNTIELQDSGGAAVPGAFSSLTVGERIALSGSSYDDTYVVASISGDGSSITVTDANGTITADATDAAEVRMQVFAAAGKISTTSYYSGDDNALTHRVDDDRSFEFDIQANDPAFEKAIRAMKLILQGVTGTEGGLDKNNDRIDDAKYLLNAAMEQTVDGTPPFGTELSGSLEQVEQDIGFDQFLINTINATHTTFIGFLDQSVANIENADPLDTITRLLDDERALSASYQTFARIRQLSLTNFL